MSLRTISIPCFAAPFSKEPHASETTIPVHNAYKRMEKIFSILFVFPLFQAESFCQRPTTHCILYIKEGIGALPNSVRPFHHYALLTTHYALLFSGCQKYFQSNPDKNTSPQDGRLVCQFHAKFLSQQQSSNTNPKRHHPDDDARQESLRKIVFRNGESHGQRIHRRSHPLNEKVFEPHFGLHILLFPRQAIPNHESADGTEKDQSRPRNKGQQKLKNIHDPIDTEPAGHGHEPLEESKSPRNETHLPPLDEMILQAIGQGHREGIHSQPHA